MTNQIPAGYMQNAQGHLVPEDQVRPQDKLRDQCVNQLIKEALEINLRLAEFKKNALADLAALVETAAEKYGVNLGGYKGNLSVLSYNGQYKLTRTYADVITFTEEIEAAKELFGQCLDDWTADANHNLRALIDRAFRPNKNGQMKTSELLGLLRLDIDEPKWKQACQALQDSIHISSTAVYIRAYERIGTSDQYRHINLDLAGV